MHSFPSPVSPHYLDEWGVAWTAEPAPELEGTFGTPRRNRDYEMILGISRRVLGSQGVLIHRRSRSGNRQTRTKSARAGAASASVITEGG
jgi:hypothetical protein